MNAPYRLIRRPAEATRHLVTVTGLVLALVTGLATPDTAHATASLAIAPTRVVFEGRARTASVNLINNGSTAATFRISFERKRMTEDGGFENIKKPRAGELFADQMLRYSPRQITLAPGQSQVVRLMVRKPANLPDGEYRSHMLFREIPRDSGRSINVEKENNKKLSIQIIPVVGLSIPVIVRQGKGQSEVKLTGLKLRRAYQKPGAGTVELTAVRKGKYSVFGDFTIVLDRGGKAEELVVGKSNGLAIYTPNPRRKLQFNIQAPKGVTLDSGTLRVLYRTPPDQGDKLIASAELPLGKDGN